MHVSLLFLVHSPLVRLERGALSLPLTFASPGLYISNESLFWPQHLLSSFSSYFPFFFLVLGGFFFIISSSTHSPSEHCSFSCVCHGGRFNCLLYRYTRLLCNDDFLSAVLDSLANSLRAFSLLYYVYCIYLLVWVELAPYNSRGCIRHTQRRGEWEEPRESRQMWVEYVNTTRSHLTLAKVVANVKWRWFFYLLSFFGGELIGGVHSSR